MANGLFLFEIEIVGGIVGDAIQNTTNIIVDGIIYGFQYVALSATKIISYLSGASMLGQEMIYFASKDGKDRGKIIKYFLVYVASNLIGGMIYAIARN